MANGQQPSINDCDANLWKKIANNWYNYAIDFGGTGLTPPSINDNIENLAKKTCYATAVLVDLKP